MTANDVGGAAPWRGAARWAGAAAFACAAVACGLLGVRTITSLDIGYHLRYGHDGIVQSSPYLFTLPPPDLPADQRPTPGPGSWYDSNGRYCFANANWLTQAILWRVNELGGAAGLCVLRALLVTAMLGLSGWAAVRLGAGVLWAAAGMLLAAMAGFERFLLRPELLGYVVLLIQFHVLLSGPPRWRGVAALIALQAIMVNLHSYFVLNLAVTGAFLAAAGIEAIGRHMRGQRGQRGELRQPAMRLGVAMVGQLLACLANPWTWRLAILPVQTLLFLRQPDLDTSGGGVQNPWLRVDELFATLSPGFQNRLPTYAFQAVLGVGIAGAACGLIGLIAGLFRPPAGDVRRDAGILPAKTDRTEGKMPSSRLACLLILAGMTAVALATRRNIALGTIFVAPIALAELRRAARWLAGHVGVLRHGAWALAGGLAVSAASAAVGALVVGNGFYADQRHPARFGLGYSRLEMPLDAMAWLNRVLPSGAAPPSAQRAENMWTDINSSSILMYFRWRQVPGVCMSMLTNTYAYPPAWMSEALDVQAAREPLARVLERWPVDVFAMHVSPRSIPLVRELLGRPDWKLAYLDALYAVFLPADKRAADGRDLPAITADTLDVGDYLARVRACDPVPAQTLYAAGMTLFLMQWNSPAVQVLRAAVAADDTDFQAWETLGSCLAVRAIARWNAGDWRAGEDFQAAQDSFARAAALRPDNDASRKIHELVRQQFERFRMGMKP